MLCGGDQDSLAHQAGSVGDLGDISADGLNLKVVEVGAAEDDTSAGGCREESQLDGGAAMKTDSGKCDAAVDCLFELSLHVRLGHLCRVTGAFLQKIESTGGPFVALC